MVFVPAGARSNAASFSVTSVSLIAMPFTVTLPLFVTTTVYVTLSPTATSSVGSAVFSTVSAALTSLSNFSVRIVPVSASVALRTDSPSFRVNS